MPDYVSLGGGKWVLKEKVVSVAPPVPKSAKAISPTSVKEVAVTEAQKKRKRRTKKEK